MSESLLEAVWREHRKVEILYYQNTRPVSATGYLVDLRPGEVTFRSTGGFDFILPLGDIIRIDGRNPLMDDKPDAPPPPVAIRGQAYPSNYLVVFYASGRPKLPNQELSIQGHVEEVSGGLKVETNDGRELFVPHASVIRVETPGPHFNPYPGYKRVPELKNK